MADRERDEANMSLEERRLALEEELQRERLRLEHERHKHESSFTRAHLGVIITALLSVATIIVSWVQFRVATLRSEADTVARMRQEEAATNLQQDEWRLNVLRYLSDHRAEIYSSDPQVRAQVRTALEATLPHDILVTVLKELEQGAASDMKGTWSFQVIHSWVLVGIGGCDQQDLPPETPGEKPAPQRCNAGSEGTIALCSGDSCSYKAVDPEECPGSTAQMYQCVPEVVHKGANRPAAP